MTKDNLTNMSDIIENKPRRRRVVRGGDSLLATSNETKMKDKARVVEKKNTPLFNITKPSVVEKNSEIVGKKSEQEDVVMFANPLPAEEKPKKTRTSRKTVKTSPEEEKENDAPVASEAAPEKKRRGRPKKQQEKEESVPSELVAEALPQESKKSHKLVQYPLFEEDADLMLDAEPEMSDISENSTIIQNNAEEEQVVKTTRKKKKETSALEDQSEAKPRRGRPKKKTDKENSEKQKEVKGEKTVSEEAESSANKVEESIPPYLANAQYDGSVMAEGVLEITSENCGFLRSSARGSGVTASNANLRTDSGYKFGTAGKSRLGSVRCTVE